MSQDLYIEANGIRHHVIDHAGDGPVLVLAPGLTSNAHSFDGLIAHGLAPSLRVLAFDLRGRGESDKPSGSYEMSDHAADVLGVLDEIGVGSVAMGGHSFGGMLSFYMAANHPGRVNRVVGLDPPAEVNETVANQIKPSLSRLGNVVPSLEAYIDALKAQPYYRGWWDPLIENYVRADVEEVPGGVRAKSNPNHILAAVEGTTHIDWPALQMRISQPTLLVRAMGPYGPEGSPPILSASQAGEILDRIDNARVVEIDANHMTMLFGKAAGRTVAAILDFVKQA